MEKRFRRLQQICEKMVGEYLHFLGVYKGRKTSLNMRECRTEIEFGGMAHPSRPGVQCFSKPKIRAPVLIGKILWRAER